MSRFGEASAVGKADEEPKARVQPLKYALPAAGIGIGAHSLTRAIKPNVGGMQAKATQGLKDADSGMLTAVSRLNQAKKEPTAMRMGRKALMNSDARSRRVKQISHRQNLASAKRGVEFAERNILTAAQRYRAVQQVIPRMMEPGPRLKRGAVGVGLMGLGSFGAIRQRKKEKANAQVW